MVVAESEMIPMGTVHLESPLDPMSTLPDSLDTPTATFDLRAALVFLRQRNFILLQPSVASECNVLVFGCTSTSSTTHRKHSPLELTRAKSALATVLLNLDVNPSNFKNDGTGHVPYFEFQHDAETHLIDVYTEMPSPNPGASLDNNLSYPATQINYATRKLLDTATSLDAPMGMRTKLYDYQKNSLWKMLNRELCPGFLLDPSTIPMLDMTGKEYYIDYSDNEWCFRRYVTRKWNDIRGGILCEDMGTGKTAMCIALILHTKHQFSTPPSPFTPVYCELAPFVPSRVTEAENMDIHDLMPRLILSPSSSIPSLQDLAAASCKINGVEYRRFEEYIGTEAFNLLESHPVYYFHDDSDPNRNHRHKRKATAAPMKVYLSSTTLIIVPENLVAQWCNEINKHTYDSALNLLVLTRNTLEIPELEKLMSFDIVLISQGRFAKEHVVRGAYHARDQRNPGKQSEYGQVD
ncbi:hypothetical protein BGZ94_007062 [Podila epigama]|nr:hypothetical protein BGZ94_007062 [Podila epigama]